MRVPRLKAALTILALVATAALLVAVVLSLVRGRGPVGSSEAAREQCLAGYRRARSAADSAMVDAWTPVLSKGQAPFAKPCVLIRRDGELEPPGGRRGNSRAPAP